MEFNIPSQETIIHSFPTISFPFSTQHLAFATSEARILQKNRLISSNTLNSFQKQNFSVQRDTGIHAKLKK